MRDHPRLRIVVSSSPEDTTWRAKLLQHLRVLERFRSVEVWTDAEVDPGADWRAEVDRELGRADVALLMVSSAYLASDHLQDVEVPQLFERHKTGGVQVIPVLVRSCAWELHPWIGEQERPPRSRELRPALHRRNYWEACTKIAQLLALAMPGLRDPERGDSAGSGRAHETKRAPSTSSSRRRPARRLGRHCVLRGRGLRFTGRLGAVAWGSTRRPAATRSGGRRRGPPARTRIRNA